MNNKIFLQKEQELLQNNYCKNGKMIILTKKIQKKGFNIVKF